MRWGEENNTVRVHILYRYSSQCLPSARFGRVMELVTVYYYIIFSAKKRGGSLWLRRVCCFPLSPRNMIEFSCALCRRSTLPPAGGAANCFLTRKIPTKDVGGRGLLVADLGVSQTLRISGGQGTPGEKKPLHRGKFSNNGSRGNRVK